MKGRWRLWIPVAAWVLMIFVFSTDSFSAQKTSGFILSTLRYLFPSLNEEQLHFWHIVCRKAAHMTEYGVLGLLSWRAFRGGSSLSGGSAAFAVAAFVLAVALTDEFHQSFVGSRTGALGDVGYDFAGGVIALILVQVFRRESRTVHSHSVL
jgi:VanZ family protein